MRFTYNVCTTGLFVTLAALSGCSSGGSSSSSGGGTTAPGATQGGAPTTLSGATVKVSAMTVPRGCHTATSTPQGVVVIGGEDRGQVLSSVEVYQNGAWTAKGQLSAPRKGHTATLLRNGRVLVVGGQTDAAGSLLLASCEVYDPITGTFSPAGALATPRSDHLAIAFDYQGREMVLVAGGVSAGGTSVATAEIYDVATNRFSQLPTPMASDRAGAQAALLSSGKVLIAGGMTGFSVASPTPRPAAFAEVFDPATLTFTATPAQGIARFGAALAMTDRGQAFLVGGDNGAQIQAGGELYDPATGAWSNSAARLAAPREDLSLTAVRGGQLLAVGGSAKTPSAAVELYNGNSDTMSTLSGLQVARQCHTATALANGNVLIVGGYDAKGSLATAEEYDAFAPVGTKPAAVPTTVVPPIGTLPPITTQQNPPKVLAVLPGKGKPGDLITIAGQEFAPSKQDNQVWFQGGVQGKVMLEVKVKRLPFLGAVQTLVVEVPQGAQSGDLTVVSRGRQSPGKSFTIDMQSGGEPKILRTLQSKAAPNSMITIFGRNFARPANQNIVRFSGVPGAVVGGITTQSIPFLGNVAVMLAIVPPNAVTGDLTVEANGKVSPGYAFEVIGTTPAPGGTVPGTTTPGTTTPGTTTPGTPALTSVFSEDFEGATVNLSAQGGLWEAARPALPGPAAAASGQWCAGTSMTSGRYAPGADGYLITPEIDLAGRTQAELRFNQWFETDGVDAGRVIVSSDGGQTWRLVRPQGGYGAAAIYQPGEGFTGQSGGWLLTTFDLTAFAGQKVIVAFEFRADGADERTGWYVDDIEVRAN